MSGVAINKCCFEPLPPYYLEAATGTTTTTGVVFFVEVVRGLGVPEYGRQPGEGRERWDSVPGGCWVAPGPGRPSAGNGSAGLGSFQSRHARKGL